MLGVKKERKILGPRLSVPGPILVPSLSLLSSLSVDDKQYWRTVFTNQDDWQVNMGIYIMRLVFITAMCGIFVNEFKRIQLHPFPLANDKLSFIGSYQWLSPLVPDVCPTQDFVTLDILSVVHIVYHLFPMTGPETDSGARRQPHDQEVRSLRHRLPGIQTCILS